MSKIKRAQNNLLTKKSGKNTKILRTKPLLGNNKKHEKNAIQNKIPVEIEKQKTYKKLIVAGNSLDKLKLKYKYLN